MVDTAVGARPWVSRGAMLALGFTGVYIGAAGVVAVVQGNYEFLLYVGVMAGATGTVVWIHRRMGGVGGLSERVLWCLSLWGLAHMAGGLVRVPGPTEVLYNWWIVGSEYGRGVKYDQVVHGYGYGVATWLVWEIARPGLGRRRPGVVMLAGCVLAANGVGALNEVVEFAATKMLEATNVGDYENNAWDLIYNAVGTVAAAGAIWWKHRGREGV